MRLARIFSMAKGELFEVYVNDEVLVPEEIIPCGDNYRERLMKGADLQKVLVDMDTDMSLLRRSLIASTPVCRQNQDGILAGYYSIRALRTRIFHQAPAVPREPWEQMPPEQIVELAKGAVRVELRSGWISGLYRVVVDVPYTAPNVPTQLMLHETSDDEHAQSVANAMREVLVMHMLTAIGKGGH